MNDSPLGEHAFLVMTVLAAGAQHGYAIIEDLRGRNVRLHTGTLYALLDRLRTGGLVEVDREETVQSRLRRYYRLSETGAQRLAAESVRMRALADAAEASLARFRPALGGGAA